MRWNLIVVLLCVLGLQQSFGQEYFVLETECFSGAYQMHVTENGDAFIMVSEYCNDQDRRTHLCVPGEEDDLVIQSSFEGEYADADFVSVEGWYVLFGSDSGFHLRLFDEVDVLLEQQIELPLQAAVTEIHIDGNRLIACYFLTLDNQFVIERYSIDNGQSEEQIMFSGVPFVYDHQAVLISPDGDPSFYLGISCAWRFRFDPNNLAENEVFALPVDDLTEQPFNPCSTYDVMYDHPDPDILFSASSVLGFGDDYYTIYFNHQGEYLGYDEISSPGGYNPYQYVYDDQGGRMIILHQDSSDSANGTNDLLLRQVDASNDLVESEVYETPDINEVTLSGMLREETLHRIGYDLQSEDFENGNALYVRFDTNDFTNIAPSVQYQDTFINTDDYFGLQGLKEPLPQYLFSISGELIVSEMRKEMWNKALIPNGLYVLKVQKPSGIESYLISIH